MFAAISMFWTSITNFLSAFNDLSIIAKKGTEAALIQIESGMEEMKIENAKALAKLKASE